MLHTVQNVCSLLSAKERRLSGAREDRRKAANCARRTLVTKSSRFRSCMTGESNAGGEGLFRLPQTWRSLEQQKARLVKRYA